MTFADLVPASGEHAIFVGKNGSGKTFGAEQVVRFMRIGDRIVPRRFVLAYDPKGLLKWGKRATRVTSIAEVVRRANQPDRYPWIVYAPSAKELRDPKAHEAFFRLAYDRRNTTVYLDEVYAIAKGQFGQDYPESYHAILTRGREMRVELIAATQRPSKIPQETMSESRLWYTFRLTMPQDRKKVSEMIPVSADALATLPKGRFYFYRDGDDQASGPHVLDVAGKPKL